MNNIGKNIYRDFDDEDILKELDILKKFKSHNILNERILLYEEFTINLLYKLYETYLGKEYINNKKDAEGHYNWCFSKILEEYDEQEISFYENDELYDYFFRYYLNQLYTLNSPVPLKTHEKTWKNIFNYKKQKKSSSEFNLLIEIYEIFDLSIQNKKRVLEKI